MHHVTLICAAFLIAGIHLSDGTIDDSKTGSDYWREIAYKELREKLSDAEFSVKKAKNVILFLGDGMGPVSVTAARFYFAKSRGLPIQEAHFAWDKFPYTGIAKPYHTDYMVADSAGSATAYLCGVKTKMSVVGMNEYADTSDCENAARDSLDSILTVAKKQGKKTGLVTNTRVTHATPAATYAHVPHRYFEYEVPAPVKYADRCKDIASQLVEDTDFNIVLAGGRNSFRNTTDGGKRTDGRDLIKEWKYRKGNETLRTGHRYAYVETAQQLAKVDPEGLHQILGLFSDSHMDYDYDRVRNNVTEQPSLVEMTRFALKALMADNKDGYFLVVEGGRIDHAHHANNAFRAFNETAVFSDVITMTLKEVNTQDTLVIVTADHGHSLVMGSYPKIDGDILGFADSVFAPFSDDKPVLAVNYITGQGYSVHRMVDGKDTPRMNLTGVDTTDPEFIQDALIPRLYSSHGGQDVQIYARGPGASLFTGVHEQHYIHHAISYAACVPDSGVESRHCGGVSSAGRINPVSALVASVIVAVALAIL